MPVLSIIRRAFPESAAALALLDVCTGRISTSGLDIFWGRPLSGPWSVTLIKIQANVTPFSVPLAAADECIPRRAAGLSLAATALTRQNAWDKGAGEWSGSQR